MKKYIFYSLLLSSCNGFNNKESEHFVVDKTEKVVCNNNNYEIINKYPKLGSVQNDNKQLSELNIFFENVNELSTWNCDAESNNGLKNTIIGDYNILGENDSIVLFEFYLMKNNAIAKYKPVILNIKKLQLIESQNELVNVSKTKLKKYVENFTNETGKEINLSAYDENSNAKLSYLKTGDSLILYLGEEGEFGGKYKLKIPIDSVIIQ